MTSFIYIVVKLLFHLCVCVRGGGELERDIKCTFITWVMIKVVCENRCLLCDLCDSSDPAPAPVCSLPSTRRVLGVRGGGAEGGRNERVLSILLHPRPLRPPDLLIHIAVLQSRHRSIRQIGNKRLRRLRLAQDSRPGSGTLTLFPLHRLLTAGTATKGCFIDSTSLRIPEAAF